MQTPRLYACIVSSEGAKHIKALTAIAERFSPRIEVLGDGVLFDVSGLNRLVGGPEKIYRSLSDHVKAASIPGKIAVTSTAYSSMLLARQERIDKFEHIPISALNIEKETLTVFGELGIEDISDLRGLSENSLYSRYGSEFQNLLTDINFESFSYVDTNIRKTKFPRSFIFETPITKIGQVLDEIGSALEGLFALLTKLGLSTDRIDILLTQRTRRSVFYEVKSSFPTLDLSFWRRLISLRFEQSLPDSELLSGSVVAHSTRQRSVQKSLYTRPECTSEEIDLTLLKLRGLVGAENVGIPVLLDLRGPEPFMLETSPTLKFNSTQIQLRNPIITFNYFRPAIPVKVRFIDRSPVYVDSYKLKGKVVQYGGEWIAGSSWWCKPWQAKSWDIEMENGGIYLLTSVGDEFRLNGEYD